MFAAPPFVNLVVLRSGDIDRAATFYSAMGLLFMKHSHGTGPEHYSSEVAGFVFEIYPIGPAQQPTTSTRIGFSVDDVDSVIHLLEEVGGKVISSPVDSEWGRRAVIRDLDGHTVELITPPNRDRMKDGLTDTHADGMTPGDRSER
jgi:lactoylglutathione lyase